MTFDPAVATAAYIDGLGPEALAKAAAYTTGGHWLLLLGACHFSSHQLDHHPPWHS